MYKTYCFGIKNWKNDFPARYIYKKFPSAFCADRWATKISFKRNSVYMVWLIPGAEEQRGEHFKQSGIIPGLKPCQQQGFKA